MLCMFGKFSKVILQITVFLSVSVILEIHVCENRSPCQNGGTCLRAGKHFNDDQTYECKCPLGFSGKDCQNSKFSFYEFF